MHVVLFPFMSKGHTIPFLQLAHHLRHGHRHRDIAITFFTTPANHPFVSSSISNIDASLITLPFPKDVHPEIPSGIESTDDLPSLSLFPHFALATKSMQPHFEKALEDLINLRGDVNLLVSDGFLWWTQGSSTKFKFPRVVLYTMANYVACVSSIVAQEKLLDGSKSDTDLVTLTQFPWVKVSRDDFAFVSHVHPEAEGPLVEFERACTLVESYGLLLNSFHELEPDFHDYIKANGKAWCIGPLCWQADDKEEVTTTKTSKTSWIQWLDAKLEQGMSVLYVAFGSQAEVSADQLKEIATGLEESRVNFLWLIRKKEVELGHGFEERVKGRGMVGREWVGQREILAHPSVEGFLSHCGWNSVLESICAGVPILAWPMMAEQPLNARMVAEEIKVGFRVETCDGLVRGFVGREELKKKIKELMEEEKGKEVRKRVKEYQVMAHKAMEVGRGSSWRTLDMLIDEVCGEKK